MTIYLENNSFGHGQYSLTARDIELCLRPAFKMLSNRIGGVMVSMFASSPVDHTKDYEIGICCSSAKH